jgi:hypothetical protein
MTTSGKNRERDDEQTAAELIEAYRQLENTIFARNRDQLECMYCSGKYTNTGGGGNSNKRGVRLIQLKCNECGKSTRLSTALNHKDLIDEHDRLIELMDKIPVVDAQEKKQKTIKDFYSKTPFTMEIDEEDDERDWAAIVEKEERERDMDKKDNDNTIEPVIGQVKSITDYDGTEQVVITILKGEYEEMRDTATYYEDLANKTEKRLYETRVELEKLRQRLAVIEKQTGIKQQEQQQQHQQQKQNAKRPTDNTETEMAPWPQIGRGKPTAGLTDSRREASGRSMARGRPSRGIQPSSGVSTTWAKVAVTPPKPGNEQRAKWRTIVAKPMNKLSSENRQRILAMGQERGPSQKFYRTHIKMGTVLNETVGDARRRMGKFLVVAGLKSHIRTYSNIGKSILEIYYCDATKEKVEEIIREKRLARVDIDPADTTGIDQATWPKRKEQIIGRLAFLLAKERLQEMRKIICAGFDADIIKLAEEKAASLNEEWTNQWSKKYSNKSEPAVETPKAAAQSAGGDQ